MSHWCVPILVALASPAPAHEAWAEYVWHRVEFRADARQVEVTVQLTFFEDWSVRERGRMDADGDGKIDRAERDAYGRTLATELKTKLRLTAGGRDVALIPLYEPEIDLLGRATVERAHHQLTLRFFATLPAGIASDAEMVVEDRLWSEALCHGEIATGAGVAGKVIERAKGEGGETAPLRFMMPQGSGTAFRSAEAKRFRYNKRTSIR